MKCILGFILFWIGIGMLIMMFLPVCFEVVLVVAALIGFGYFLFCKDWEDLRIRNCQEHIKKQTRSFPSAFLYQLNYALSTAPDFKQEVHTYVFFAPPFTLILTDLILDFHILLDLLCEWLTLLPKWALLPQIAHFAMILHLLANKIKSMSK